MQESEFQINPETDYSNLPKEMRFYVDHFFQQIAIFKDNITSRCDKVLKFGDLAQLLQSPNKIENLEYYFAEMVLVLFKHEAISWSREANK